MRRARHASRLRPAGASVRARREGGAFLGRAVRRVLGVLAIVLGLLAGVVAAPAGVVAAQAGESDGGPGGEWVGRVRYEAQATREDTLNHMLAQLQPDAGRWGEWWRLAPFSFAGHDTGDLATRLPPEAELARMTAGGPGPDLDAEYEGKLGRTIRWQSIGWAADELVDLDVHEDAELNSYAVAYLATTIIADRDLVVPVTMGSDDGLRFWLNGELLVDVDLARGLDPESEKVDLHLSPGVNHVLAKITEGEGAWSYQIKTQRALDPRTDARLHDLVDRDFPPAPDRAAYDVLRYPLPDDLVLEVGGLATLGDGRPVVTTRRGDVLIVEGAYEVPPYDVSFTTFASGLHEPLGVAVREDADGEAVYVVQRGELTRLRDVDGDDRADVYETFSDGWGVSGNYHEFAFGPEFDGEGNAWVTLNVGFCGALGKSIVPWRGWAVKITPDGELIPVCDGLRSPNGMAMLPNGEMFYVDNQGDYVATNRLSHLAPGSWHGHPASLRWREGLAEGETPPRQPASVWFPYRKMGQSAADIVLDDTDGAFGPFAGQLFVGDQTLATVMRVDLEQVDGHWQGACFPFVEALDCGVNRLAFAPDGSLLVGQTDRGWASVGRRPFGLQRIVWNGETPFECRSVRARPDGFELHFTADVDPVSAADPASYELSSYTYAYHPEYGAPEDDTQELRVAAAELVDPRTVRLAVEPLRAGYVHELSLPGVRAAGNGSPLVHDVAYYTLERIPVRR